MTTANDTRMGGPAAPPWWKVLLLMAGGAAVGGTATYALLQLPGVLPSLRAANVYHLLALPVLVFAVILLHEIGHLAAGAAWGLRPILLLVGPLRAVRPGARWHVTFNSHLATWGGMAAAIPVGRDATVAQLSALVAGGPAASLGLAIMAGLAAHWLEGAASVLAAVTGGFSALIFACTAMPLRAGPMMSDGAQWLQLRRGGQEVRRRLLINHLVFQSVAGIRPRDLDPDALCDIVANAPAHQVVFAHLLALAHNQDHRATEQAQLHADALARMFDGLPALLRSSIACELAYASAAIAGDATAAGQWVERSGRGVLEAYQPLRARAAVALIQGRTEDARALALRAAAVTPAALDRGAVILVNEQLAAIADGRFRESGGAAPTHRPT